MRLFKTIRQKLILALLVVLLPLVILQGVTIYKWRDARVDALLRGRMDAAHVAASAYTRFVMDIVHQNHAAQALLGLENRPFDRNQIRRFLAELKSPYNSLQTYAVTDPNGRIVASDPTSVEGLYIGDRDFFKKLKAGERWTVSDMIIGRRSHTPTFVIANSIIGDDGDFHGIVLATVDVDMLRNMFPTELTEGEIVLVDSNGRLVLDSRVAGVPWEKRDWSQVPTVREALRGEPGVSTSYVSPLTRQRVMGSFVPVKSVRWAAGSFLPVDKVMAPIRDWMNVVLLSGAIAILASVALVWLLGTYLTRPVRKLTRATKDFAAGMAVTPVHLTTGDELQTLAESFNAMKEQIADRETRLSELAQVCEAASVSAEARAAELEVVLQSIPVGVIIAEGEDGRLAQSNPAADKLLGRAAPLGAAIDQYSSECGLFKPTGEPYPTRELPLSRAIIEGRLIADQEVVVERPDGSRITVLTTASPIKDERGRVTRAVLVFQDISERKRAEERQRTIAEVLQDSLMPELPAEVGGLKVASKYVAALEEARVGGDFIDVFDISSSRVAVVVGDVSGKGLSAAVEVAMTKYYIRSYCYAHPESPGEVLARVNGAMLHHVDDERFVTAFLAIFDTDTFTLSYASAGHEPGLVRRAQDNTLEELRPTGMALGVTLGFQHEQKSIELQPEDLLILYTDGATEARSPDGEMLTFEGLKHIISKSAKAGAQDTCDSTFLAIREYTAGRLRDDLALLVVGAC